METDPTLADRDGDSPHVPWYSRAYDLTVASHFSSVRAWCASAATGFRRRPLVLDVEAALRRHMTHFIGPKDPGSSTERVGRKGKSKGKTQKAKVKEATPPAPNRLRLARSPMEKHRPNPCIQNGRDHRRELDAKKNKSLQREEKCFLLDIPFPFPAAEF